jgi:hypothetical protein
MFIPDPGSGCWLSTHSGSRIQGSKRHRIPDPDPQHCRQDTIFHNIFFSNPRAGGANFLHSSECLPYVPFLPYRVSFKSSVTITVPTYEAV